jgi:DNA-binding transcriptional regulator PaaX
MTLWITQQLIAKKVPPEEIVELFHIRFPRAGSIQFNANELSQWASENLTGWDRVEPVSVEGVSLEEEIEKEVKGVITDEKFLDTTDSKKVDAIQKHRRILLENWDNYWHLKTSESPNENAKKSYLDGVREELKILSELESKEKSFLSILEEVKTMEDTETAEQVRDYVEGYCLQKIATKLNDIKKIKEQMEALKINIDTFVEILETAPNVEEGVRRFLTKLHV